MSKCWCWTVSNGDGLATEWRKQWVCPTQAWHCWYDDFIVQLMYIAEQTLSLLSDQPVKTSNRVPSHLEKSGKPGNRFYIFPVRERVGAWPTWHSGSLLDVDEAPYFLWCASKYVTAILPACCPGSLGKSRGGGRGLDLLNAGNSAVELGSWLAFKRVAWVGICSQYTADKKTRPAFQMKNCLPSLKFQKLLLRLSGVWYWDVDGWLGCCWGCQGFGTEMMIGLLLSFSRLRHHSPCWSVLELQAYASWHNHHEGSTVSAMEC